MGFCAGVAVIMTFHWNYFGPEAYRKKQYREISEANDMFFKNRNINPNFFGERTTYDPFNDPKD